MGLRMKRIRSEPLPSALVKDDPPLNKACNPQEGDNDSVDPVAYWAATTFWPKSFWFGDDEMNTTSSRKRKTHESTILSHQQDCLELSGIVISPSSLFLSTASRKFCANLLKGDRRPSHTPFPAERFSSIREYVSSLNEARINRDLTPWLIPSAELLFLSGELHLEHIGEEINAEWGKCQTMGSTHPKPDYVAGIRRKGFTEDEFEKLQNYATASKPCRFTPELCFPFLVCEVKSAEVSLGQAERQNIHSAAIAVRAIIELYKTAFGNEAPEVKELYGKVLVFTVSHNDSAVVIYGHFCAVTKSSPEKLRFYRYHIGSYFFTMQDSVYTTYNFVRNVYDQFFPDHLQRIRDAVAQLSRDETRDLIDSQQSSEEITQPKRGKLDFEKTYSKQGIEQQSQPNGQQWEQWLEQQRQQTEQLLEQQKQQIQHLMECLGQQSPERTTRRNDRK